MLNNRASSDLKRKKEKGKFNVICVLNFSCNKAEWLSSGRIMGWRHIDYTYSGWLCKPFFIEEARFKLKL